MSDRDEFTQDAAWLAFHVRRLLGESPGTPAWEVVTSEAAEALADRDANRKPPHPTVVAPLVERLRAWADDASWTTEMVTATLAEAADEIERFHAAVERVRGLHHGPVPDRRGGAPTQCAHCCAAWPCPTVEVLDGVRFPLDRDRQP